MGKYDELKYLKKTKARVDHQCNQCGVTIVAGDYYYKETKEDRFLQSLHARSFCIRCYEKHGESLLAAKKKKKAKYEKSKKISDFV